MAILEDKHWCALFKWIEDHEANGSLEISQYDPQRPNGPNGQLSVWLHSLSKETSKDGSAATTHPILGEKKPNRPPSQRQVKRQFRPLTEEEIALLKVDKNKRLWPEPKPFVGGWLSQKVSDIAFNLHVAISYLNGHGSLSDEVFLKGTVKGTKEFPFKVPVDIVLDDMYRGDAIMRGLHSPSVNLDGARQHWKARSYMCYRDGAHMGAVIAVRGGVLTPNHIDICELQALMILLDRQTVYVPEKRKPRAWLLSIKTNGFRVLEAYLDQDVNRYEFHFSLVDEEYWPRDLRDEDDPNFPKTILGGDDEWKWLLSWALAQPID